MSRLKNAALAYAGLGWAVFPLSPGTKIPLKGSRGCLDATTDPDTIRAWWADNPAANIGLGCGPSGVVAVDLDTKDGRDGPASWAALKEQHAIDDHSAPLSRTPSGGWHILFTANGDKMGNSSGKLGDGIDVRAEGGYIVLPPSILQDGTSYAWQEGRRPTDCTPPALPRTLAELLAGGGNGAQPRTSPSSPIHAEAYARAALQGELGKLALANEGGRNHALNMAAFNLGQLVGAGALDRGDVESRLLAVALAIGLGEREALATIESGLGDGEQEPRAIPAPTLRAAESPPERCPVMAAGLEPAGERRPAPVAEPADLDGPLYWDSKEAPATDDYIAALASLGYTFRMNTCSDVVEVNREPMSDALRSKIRAQMRDLNYHRVNVCEDAWTAHAYDNRYHPVRDFLAGLKWDGRDHIKALASHFQDQYEYFEPFTRRWLIGAVARACEPRGCQNRMLALDGEQGLGKSHYVRWLASPVKRPELFVEGPIDPEDKDDKIRLITAWLWEVSELGSTTRRSDREALKYFLSMQQVTVRRSYGHFDLVKPALASFIGTVNDVGGFLDDPTGNRRFMAVHVTGIDWQYSQRVDPAQVWAQAKALYDAGEPWELTAQEAKCALYANQQYEVEDPIQELFLRKYKITGNRANFVATVDIRQTLNDLGWRLNSPRAEAAAIAGMLKGLGVEKGRQAREGVQERGFVGIEKAVKAVDLDL